MFGFIEFASTLSQRLKAALWEKTLPSSDSYKVILSSGPTSAIATVYNKATTVLLLETSTNILNYSSAGLNTLDLHHSVQRPGGSDFKWELRI